jgi:acyl-CoA synthetase (AMP-forming)/AMP-acid ligase II/acyl carrier protein
MTVAVESIQQQGAASAALHAEQKDTLHGLLEAQALRDPDAPAILAPGRAPLSYGRLHAEVLSVGKALNAMGIGQRDRVCLVLENGPEMAVAFLGITSAATLAPLNPAYLESEFEFYLGDLGIKALVLSAGVPSRARSAARKKGIRAIELSPSIAAEAGVFTLSSEGQAAEVVNMGLTRPGSVVLVLPTSGTTAKPKIVPLMQQNLHAAARAMAEVLELGPKDRCLNVMPLFHIHGLSTLSASLVAGASVVCPPPFDPLQFLGWVEAFDPTWITAAPTIHHAILELAQQNPEVIARHPLRFLRSASSAMPPQVITELERLFKAPFIEAYGMTEACPLIASNRLPPGKRKLGSVGPAAGTEVAIVDEAGRTLPTGQPGEVVIKGPNVMCGYEDNPAENEAAVIDGFLRTGDQGYLDADGYLFITGRLKEIINRGGEKISPREVEEVLLAHPAVAEAVTFAVPHFRLGEDVASAVVLRPGKTAAPREIQAFAALRLADFKVPRQLVIVPEIPKGATAKLKRLGLADKFGLSDAAQIDDKTPFLAPRTKTEEIVASICSQVLKIEQIGIHDDFFRLGGDSILAVRVISQIREALKVTLKLQHFFLGSTVAELSRHVEEEARAATGQGSAPIPRLSPGAPAPLSFVQEGLWFLDQLDPHNAAYNVYRAAHLEGPVDAALMERSIHEIVRRHDILRTTFPSVDGRPRRVTAPEAKMPLKRVDLRHLSKRERQAEAERLAVEEARRPFDVAEGPLLRATVLLLDEEEHILLVTAHHLVFDLWSTRVFFEELATLYTAFARGLPSPLPELSIQHSDFAAFQRQQGKLFEQQLSYWKKQLADLPPPLDLNSDRPRAAARTFRGARRFFELPKSLSKAVIALSQKEGVTLFLTLLSAFKMLLARVSGQRDIVVGSPIAGRSRAEVEDLIGIFSNTLVLRTNLAGNPSFREVLGRVREVALGAYAHQDLPFEQLVVGIQPPDNRARMPLFQVNFRVQNAPVPSTFIPGVTLSFLKLSNQMAKFDLAIEFSDTVDGLRGFVEYRTDLFNAETIERLLADLEALLATVVHKPGTELAAIEVSRKPPSKEAPSPVPEAPPKRSEAPKLKSFRDVRRKAVDLGQVSLVESAPLAPAEPLSLVREPNDPEVDGPAPHQDPRPGGGHTSRDP